MGGPVLAKYNWKWCLWSDFWFNGHWVFLFACFLAMPSNVLDLLPSLCSGIIPGHAQGLPCGTEVELTHLCAREVPWPLDYLSGVWAVSWENSLIMFCIFLSTMMLKIYMHMEAVNLAKLWGGVSLEMLRNFYVKIIINDWNTWQHQEEWQYFNQASRGDRFAVS